ncbi:MAG: O-antigen ligase family protein [Clostridia bacterium]|nr:O-antigen ligase family protein [Clostridia bacterium]
MSLIKKRNTIAPAEGNTFFETLFEICTYLLLTGYFLFYDNRSLQLVFVCIGLAGSALLFFSKAYLSKLKLPLNTIWYLIFFVLAELSALWAHSPENAANSYFRLMIIMLVIGLGITQYIDNVIQVERIIKIFVFASLTFSVAQFLFTPISNLTNGYLGSSIGGNNTNTFGYIVTIAAIASFFFAYIKNLKSYYFFTIFSIICCFLSSSRKSLIVTFVGIFLLILFSHKKKNRFAHLLVGVTLAFLVFILMFEDEVLYNIVGERFESMFDFFLVGNTSREGSLSLRTYFIEFAKILLKEKPVLGHGFANFVTIVDSESNLSMGYSAHNNYWEILADLGVVGFIIYYWFYFFLFIKFIIKMFKEKDNEILALALTLLICQFAFEYGLITMASFYPQIVMSLIYVCSYASNSKRKFHYSPGNNVR